MTNRTLWEQRAQEWVSWARTPGHDAYWYYRDAFFDAVVPEPGRATLDIGCGEGRVARDLADRGHRVVGLDGSRTLLGHASESGSSGPFVLGDAHSLPFANESVDLAVSYNSLIDFDDLRAAIGEVARVLERGSNFCICIPHPLFDRLGELERESDRSDDLDRKSVSYFERRRFEAVVTREELTMHFGGWSAPLQEYFEGLTKAGFVIDLLREPLGTGLASSDVDWTRNPMFLHIRALKV